MIKKKSAIWLDEWHTQPQPNSKVVVSGATFSWWLSSYKKLRYQFTLSQYIDDQGILLSSWYKSITGHVQPKVVASDAAPTTNSMQKKCDIT